MDSPRPDDVVSMEDDDESFTAGDADINWSRVEELADRYAEVDAITDPDERLAAARALTAEMAGEG